MNSLRQKDVVEGRGKDAVSVARPATDGRAEKALMQVVDFRPFSRIFGLFRGKKQGEGENDFKFQISNSRIGQKGREAGQCVGLVLARLGVGAWDR